MSIQLVSEVIDHAPRDLSHAEWRLLIILAEKANVDTRLCWPGLEYLLDRMATTESGLRKIFGRLADRGLEVRVRLGTDEIGRPIYAHRGRQSNYRIPVLKPEKGGTAIPPLDPEKGDPTVPPFKQRKATPLGRETPRKATRPGRKGGTTGSPSPSRTLRTEPTPTRTPPADEIDRDLFGAPIEPPNPVPMIVAAYVDSVRSSGGVATSAMCGAIGKNAKRLIDVDHLHPAVVLVSAQRAGTKRAKTLDQYLGDAQQTFDRGGESRRAMFDHWQRLHDQAATAQPELGA